MCGRFAFYSPRQAVADTFGVLFPAELEPRYNIAPTQFVAAIRAGAAPGDREPVMLRWGLVPAWATDPAIGNRLINARAETVAGKPSFRSAFRRRRCVVLADGFYEWQGTAGARQPYYISRPGGGPFAMAGLWDRWTRGEDALETCTIITVPASARLAAVHGRMPAIIAPAELAGWLDGATGEPAPGDLLRSSADDAFAFHPVSRLVNNAAHQGPELIEPVSPASGGR